LEMASLEADSTQSNRGEGEPAFSSPITHNPPEAGLTQ
jgi:hypothetical protein